MADVFGVALPRRVFVDTSYVVALLLPHDQHHAAARAAAVEVLRLRPQLFTTHAVLLEVGNSLARPTTRPSALRILRSLESDPAAEIVPVTEGRYAAGRALYDSRPDQSWALTDCVSFAVMREFGLVAALTADRHFEQAGFRALLRSRA